MFIGPYYKWGPVSFDVQDFYFRTGTPCVDK